MFPPLSFSYSHPALKWEFIKEIFQERKKKNATTKKKKQVKNQQLDLEKKVLRSSFFFLYKFPPQLTHSEVPFSPLSAIRTENFLKFDIINWGLGQGPANCTLYNNPCKHTPQNIENRNENMKQNKI